MLRQKQHEIMLARLELWKKQKANKTLARATKPPLSTTSMSNNSKMAFGKVTKKRTIRKEQRRDKSSAEKKEKSKQNTNQETSSCETMREKLEAWLVEKRCRMAYERSKVKIPPWNSNKRKLPVSRIHWESEANIKLGDVKTSKYLGNYGPAKVNRSTSARQNKCVNAQKRKTINFKENKEIGKKKVKADDLSVYAVDLEAMSSDECSKHKTTDEQCISNESRAQKERRARLDEWLTAKSKTPHSVRRSVRTGTFEALSPSNTTLHSDKRNIRRETFEAVRKEKEQELEATTQQERSQADQVNSTIDECLQSCLDFMNEMGCESKVGDWLQELVVRCPLVQSRSLFWVCKAKVAEHECVGMHQVLALYEQAIDNNAKPSDILKSALQDFTIRHSNDTTPKPFPSTPRPPASALKQCNMEKNSSSVVRYHLVESTPIIDRFNDNIDGNSQHFLVTPVRRSVRIERSASRVHGKNIKCVSSLQDLPADMKYLIMKPNRALQEEFINTLD